MTNGEIIAKKILQLGSYEIPVQIAKVIDAKNAEIEALKKERDDKAELAKEISDSYLTIRGIVGAWDTKRGGVDRFEVTEKKVSDMKAELAKAREALKPVAEEITNTGNLYKENDWNPEAHIEKPIMLTVAEARKILAVLKALEAGKGSGA